MIDLNKVRKNLEEYQKVCKAKNIKIDVDKVLKLDDERKVLQQQIDKLKYQQKEFGNQKEFDKAKALKTEIQSIEEQYKQTKEDLQKIHLIMPNFMHPDTPIGSSDDDNTIIKKVGEPKNFDFEVQDHQTIGEKNDRIDKETASKVSGARFAYIKGELALLQMALINHTFQTLGNKDIIQQIITEKKLNIPNKPFTPILPPAILKMEVMDRMGRLYPMDDRYCLPEDKQVFNGSAEHTIGPMYMDHIFEEKDLPVRYIGYSSSFRREAWTYGKDTRGIFRMHQFDKLEMESFSLPEQGEQEQKLIIGLQEYLVQSLELPYQVVLKCSGDMGAIDYRGVDIETWLPGQGKYRETHTSDWMTDYQARRLNTKVKKENGDKDFVHMNDATAFALGRIMIAIIENHQTQDGKVKIPQVLQKYMGKEFIW